MILCLVGPTGVGKTKLSIDLAKKYNAIIINADSMQVYKELNIGTAKITEEEKEGIKHYLLDIKDVNEMYTVYDFQKDLRNILDKNKNKLVVLDYILKQDYIIMYLKKKIIKIICMKI